MRIDDLRPADTPEYMTQAWVDCLLWAVGEPGILDRFREESGLRWTPSRNGLEQMIDKATGVEAHFAETFVRWFNVNVWGPIDEPPAADAVDPHAADTGQPTTRA